jgi:hypothetical protein
MMNNIFLIFDIVAILYIWIDTDAFIEWAELFRLKWFKYKEYQEIKSGPLASVAGKTYCDFLLFNYGKFFLIRLVTCPLCFSVWMNIVAFLLFFNALDTRMFGFNVLLTWMIYYIFKWIIKLCYE